MSLEGLTATATPTVRLTGCKQQYLLLLSMPRGHFDIYFIERKYWWRSSLPNTILSYILFFLACHESFFCHVKGANVIVTIHGETDTQESFHKVFPSIWIKTFSGFIRICEIVLIRRVCEENGGRRYCRTDLSLLQSSTFIIHTTHGRPLWWMKIMLYVEAKVLEHDANLIVLFKWVATWIHYVQWKFTQNVWKIFKACLGVAHLREHPCYE